MPPLCREKLNINQQLDYRSIEDWTRALKKAREKGNLLDESRICHVIAKTCEDLGKWYQAIQYHLADAEICHTINDFLGEAVAKGNIAYCYFKFGE